MTDVKQHTKKINGKTINVKSYSRKEPILSAKEYLEKNKDNKKIKEIKKVKEIKKILKNNKFVKEMIKTHNKTAKNLSHWRLINLDEWLNEIIITNRDNCIALSNETEIELNQIGFEYEMNESLNNDFEKAGFNYEYSFGAFELYK